MKAFFSFVLCLILCVGCGTFSQKNWKIGVDPTWYPLKLGDREANVTAFSTELLTAIGNKEGIAITKVTVSWDEVMQGLQQGEYDAILSSMPPYLFNQKDFDFSEVYLPLGPVLLVREHSSLNSLEHLEGKEIAVVTGSTDDLLLQNKPGVIIRYYDSVAAMLNALVNQQIDGALVNILEATAYVRDLYQNELKIVTPPLTEGGLRLITKHNSAKPLLKAFNRGLEEIRRDGVYTQLMAKWGLTAEKKTS